MRERARARAGDTHPYALAVVLSALFAFFLVVSITPLANNDIWLHLANGRWILEHGHVPKTDPYSFFAGGARFYAHEWLAGLIFELTDRVFGVTGLILLKPLLGGAALLLSALAARRLGAGTLSVLACASLALAIVCARFVERPELFSYALTGLYLWVLAGEQRRLEEEPPGVGLGTLRSPWGLLRGSGLWVLVPAQWLWVQLHGYFLAGLALVGLFLAGEAAARILFARRGERRALGPRLVSGLCAFATMVAVGALNPNGVEIYLFPFVVVSTDLFMRTVFEWTPTFTTEPVRALPMFTGFCVWVGLLFVSGFDSVSLLRRHRSVRWIGATGLVLLALLHPRLAPSGLPAGLSLESSLWAASPFRLLLIVAGRPDAELAIGPVATALDAIGVFGIVWLVLLGLSILSWRNPAAATIPIVAAVLAFTLRGAGEHAMLIACVAVGGSLLYAVWRRSMRPWHALASLAFLVLAVRQNRNIVTFTLTTLPFLAAALTRLREVVLAVVPDDAVGRRRGRRPMPIGETGWLAAIAAGLLSATVYAVSFGWPYAPNYAKQPGFGIDRRFPSGAVRYARENGLEGNAFNTYFNGAYLIHELYPRTRVFVDSRMDVYGAERLETYDAALGDPAAAARVFATYPIDYAVLDYPFPPTGERDKGIFAYLGSSPEWALVYFDDEAVVYVRDEPRHGPLIARDRFRVVDPSRYRPGTIARLDPAALESYAGEVERALQRAPRSSVARLMKCEILASLGREEEALALLDTLLEDDPRNAFASIVAARLARKVGDKERSLRYYRRAVHLLPEVDELRREMNSG